VLDEQARGSLTTLRSVCGALIGGVVACGGVVAFLTLRRSFAPAAPQLAGMLLLLAGVFTVAALLSAPFVEAMLRKLPRGAERREALARFNSSVIVGFAVREGAGLFALAAALVTGQLVWGLGLAGLAVLGMVLAWPGDQRLREYLTRNGV
jgi:hypothetical protein